MTEVADRITVLRRGKRIETLPGRGRDRGEPRAADGRPRGAAARRQGPVATRRTSLLDVEDLHVFDDRGIEKVRGLSLEVRAGEIVGIAGIDGNGQTELIDAMTGLRKVGVGHGCRSTARTSPATAPTATSTSGLGHIPEDRQRRGLVLEFSIAENIALHDFRQRARLQGSAGCSRAASSSARRS